MPSGLPLASFSLCGNRKWTPVGHMRRSALDHAFSPLHLFVPPFDMRGVSRDRHLQRVAKVDDSHYRNVRNAKPVARYEFIIRQLLVELLVKSFNAQLTALNERRNLRNRLAMAGQAAIYKIRMRVPEDFRMTNHALIVGSSLPGADRCLLQSGPPHQWRLGVDRLQISPN